MLLQMESPAAAYRRSSVDARIQGASQADLVQICFEQVVASIGSAIRAHEAKDNGRRSAGLTRAHAALTALTMGVDHNAPLAGALAQLYASAREAILSSVIRFDTAKLALVRDDFRDIGEAFRVA